MTKVRIGWPALLPLLGLFLALPSYGQLKLDGLSVGMDGTLGVGYGASTSGGQTSSSVNYNGLANINGYYFDPKFINFGLSPTYNRSETNSQGEGGSLTNASSIGIGVGIFGGSHFPGSVSWNKSDNSSGTYGVPGVLGFVTTSSSTGLGIGWAILLPNLPPLGIQYSQQSTTTSIFGTSQEDHSSSRNFNLQSSYRLRGWAMSGHYTKIYTKIETPSFLSPGELNVGEENSSNLTFSASHKLPLNGGVAFNYGYGSYSGGTGSAHTSGSDDTFAGSASFLPTRRLSTLFEFQYNSNLSGEVENQLVGAGGVAPHVNLGTSSHSFSLSNSDTYYFGFNLSAGVNFARVEQEVLGQTISQDRYGAVVTYNYHKPLWGTVLVYVGVNDQAANGGNQGASLIGGANFSRTIKRWQIGGGFAYAQDVQTVVGFTTTSSYTFSGTVNRNLTRRLHWYGGFNEFRSGIPVQTGSTNHETSVYTSALYRSFALAANYSTAVSTTLITQNGLVQVPVSIPISILGANQFVDTNGSSYSVSMSGSLDRVILTGAYSHASNATTTPSLTSGVNSSTFFANASYPWRKMGFTAGYSHITQSAGATGAPSATFSSYYVGVQRWFKPF